MNAETERMEPPKKRIRAVLCDVDGTIIDTFRFGLHKLRLAAEACGYEYTDELEQLAVSIWGAPLRKLLEQCFPAAGEATINEMVTLFERLDHEHRPGAIEGVHAVFELLSEAGVVFTVLTSRDSKTLNALLSNEKLEHYFVHVAAEDTVEHKKPDPRVFSCTMQKLAEHGISIDECLLIGDTYDDWNAGKAYGMRTVIVKTGPLNGTCPDIPEENHIQSFAELPQWLERNTLLAA